MSKDDWTLVYRKFSPSEEGHREALCTLGNGLFATRGAAEESFADEVHYPGTYVAGCYNRLDTTVAGHTVTNEDLVNCPNWLSLSFRVNDEDRWFNLRAVKVRQYVLELDLRRGLLTRRISFTDHCGRRFTFEAQRLVHMDRPHLAAIRFTLTSENWSGRITVRSGLDGAVVNDGVVRYRELNGAHLDVIQSGPADDDLVYLLVRTKQSLVYIAEAARTHLFRDNERVLAKRKHFQKDGFVGTDLTFEIECGVPVRAEKIVALFTSRDDAISESANDARTAVSEANTFEALQIEQTRAWARIWQYMDIELQTDRHDQQALRLNIFHLFQTVSWNTIDRDVGVPARGLHGEAYHGHVFWDELFIFPTFTGKVPEVTRSLLKYRSRRLESARRLARKAGFRGAMYPWQSGSNGEEETQRLHLNPRSGRWLPDNSHLQRHVNLAIAYNFWRYFRTTNDWTCMYRHGIPMLVEIGRLFDSLTTYNQKSARYEILGVMGPDEYHDGYPGRDAKGVNNNAYTNVMMVWLFRQLLELFDHIPAQRQREFTDRLELQDSELTRWEKITRRMVVPFHGDGIISQFEEYDGLEEFDWNGYRKKYGNIARLDRILEAQGDTPNRYKVSKQADVCMLFFRNCPGLILSNTRT